MLLGPLAPGAACCAPTKSAFGSRSYVAIQSGCAVRNDPYLPNRRTIRIKTCDYAQPAAYFVTICAHAHRNVFGKIDTQEMELNALGKIVDDSWLELTSHFSNIRLAVHIVMPNHLHGIVSIQGRAGNGSRTHTNSSVTPIVTRGHGATLPGSIPTIIRSFKSAVSKKARAILRKPRFQVWQRGYYEHIIRDQDDFENICEYIRLNPARWHLDNENPAGHTQ